MYINNKIPQYQKYNGVYIHQEPPGLNNRTMSHLMCFVLTKYNTIFHCIIIQQIKFLRQIKALNIVFCQTMRISRMPLQ